MAGLKSMVLKQVKPNNEGQRSPHDTMSSVSQAGVDLTPGLTGHLTFGNPFIVEVVAGGWSQILHLSWHNVQGRHYLP